MSTERGKIGTFGCYSWPLGSQQSFSVVICKGLYVYYVPGVGGGFWRGCNFLRGLILGVNFEKEQNVRGSKY